MKALVVFNRRIDELLVVFNQLDEIKEAIEELKTLQVNYDAQELIIADLKKQLEPKPCDGCKHESADGFCTLYMAGLHCSRFPYARIDRYEPKDEQ